MQTPPLSLVLTLPFAQDRQPATPTSPAPPALATPPRPAQPALITPLRPAQPALATPPRPALATPPRPAQPALTTPPRSALPALAVLVQPVPPSLAVPVRPAPPSLAAPPPSSPPAPAAPTSPRRRQPPASLASAISPSARRRPRFRSPATPQSAASPGRPHLRARQRRHLTPFERAASEFSAVELRRLELEEARARMQHERVLRALKVEQERTQVFRSLVDDAQAWLDYYRNRDKTDPLNIEKFSEYVVPITLIVKHFSNRRTMSNICMLYSVNSCHTASVAQRLEGRT
ncbi:hypothetical protein ABMA27_003203 [Loxostege sticticalis]|uniref:Uncharacterized protein n=1 Tax=Loxostege sticticalis TaxID=481309 RepID=A0ABR3HSD2_LOXSC